jgi:nucleoside-diphosphate-sugar epimerase
MSRVFITGGTGFLGSKVFSALLRRGISIVALDRSGAIKERFGDKSDQVTIVKADLLEPEAYSKALNSVDTVVHLAALTGRGTPEEHFRVNAQGTEELLRQCRRTGVQRILFVSSIAAKFPNKTRYYYAQAKLSAEDAVRNSGLHFTIVRPTIIFGQGSPTLSALQKLASLPVIPIFGNGRALVQPIYVDDLIEFILDILAKNRFGDETLELGGPAVLTIEQLLQDIRRARRTQNFFIGTSVHIPFALLLGPLSAIESVGLGRLLPVSVGQLSSFRNDGTAGTNDLYKSRYSSLRNVQEMLALSLTT